MGIEFRILGPLEVRVDGTTVAVGGPRQRALLAMLLLSANRVVSRDRLIDELMDGAAHDKADRMLRVQVSRLRGSLGLSGREPDRLIAQSPGYVLRIDPGELDFQVFQDLLAEGHQGLENEDYEQAADTLRKAESLWRGRPLADLEFERFARIDIERLEEQRLAAQEARTDAELALGRHAALVPELEARVAEHPLREHSRGQLMLALYRCGRQAEALEAYRSGRARLSDELALEPSPELRRLEQSILRQEAVLDLPEREHGGVATVVAPAPPPQTKGADPPPAAPRPGRPSVLTLGVIVLGAVSIAASAVLLAWGGAPRLTASADSIAVLDPATDALRADIAAGGPPGGITTGLGAVWETDTADNLLLEITPGSRSIERIPVGRGPTGVAVGDGEVWVANQLDRTVSEINPRSLTQVASFPVGTGAAAVAFGDGSLWVANVTDDTVSRIDAADGKVKTIPLAGQPGGIAVGAQGVWVASTSTGQLLLIDPGSDQVTQAVQIGNQPAGVAVGGGSVWVANTTDHTISRFTPGTGAITKLGVGSSPVGIAYGAGSVWVADGLDGTVARVVTRTDSVQLIRVGGAPAGVAVENGRVWTAVLPGPAAHLGGTLTVADGPIYDSFASPVDPANWAGFPQWQLLSLTNDGLVTYRRTGGLAGATLVPDLATSLPAPLDGGRTYTFQMRSGIRYSNGVLVRPGDIRHEFERIYRLGDSYAEFFYPGLVGAKACLREPRHCTFDGGIVTNNAADTITFHLTAPDPDFLYKLAFPWADAIPSTAPFHTLHTPPPATGPYMTKSVSASHQSGPHGLVGFHTWELVRNSHFREWNPEAQPRGYPDRIVLTDDEPPQRAAAAVKLNKLDVLVAVQTDGLQDFALHFTRRFHSEPIGGTFGLVMNTRVAPFDRLAIRQALNYAVDRSRIVGFAGGPLAAQPTCQLLPSNIPGYRPYCPYTRHPGPSGAWESADLAKAERLVAASGTRGMRVRVLVEPPDATNPTRRIGSYLVAVLDRLGYRASFRATDQLFSILGDSASKTQIGWFPWYQDYPAPSDFITGLLTCQAFQARNPNNENDAEFCDPSIDAAVNHASSLQISAPGQASAAWSTIDRRITNQAPWLPLYNPRLDIATSSRVGNYQYHPFYGVLLDQLWVR